MEKVVALTDGLTISSNVITIFCIPENSKHLQAGKTYEMRFLLALPQVDKERILETCDKVTTKKLEQVLDNLTERNKASTRGVIKTPEKTPHFNAGDESAS